MLKLRKKEKTDYCLNCSYPLPHEYNFCPRCGQKNINNNPTFWELVTDFFQNYFSLDSKLGRSIKPFFFKPGFLTNRFNEGQRVNYVNPVRLYLIISFLYFFIVGILISKIEPDPGTGETAIIDTSDNRKKINQVDSLLKNNPEIKKNLNLDDRLEDQPDISDNMLDKLLKYAEVDSISDKALLDSLNVEVTGPSDIENRFISQLRRSIRNPELLKANIAKNLPLMMFLLLPVFALLLKFFYIRRNLLYIRHLVHSLHLHSFAFFIFGLTLLFLANVHNATWIGQLSLLVVVVYSFFSFRNVYAQSKRKTIFKLIILGFSYFFLLIIFILAELLITFLFF